MKLLRFTACITTMWICGAAPAAAVRIGVFADSIGTGCNAQVPANSSVQLYVLAILDGPPYDGITGAEFRVTGMPTNWFSSFNTTAFAALGEPITGTEMAFHSCRRGLNRIVRLGTLNIFATTQQTVTLRIERHPRPANADFDCPLVSLCDREECVPGPSTPKYSLVCAEGLSMTLNGEPCTVDAGDLTNNRLRLFIAPNPARGVTNFSFELPRSGHVRIQIHDIAGRRVRELLAGSVGAGRHLSSWDGLDSAGRPVPSGVYDQGRPAQSRVTLLR